MTETDPQLAAMLAAGLAPATEALAARARGGGDGGRGEHDRT